MILNDIDTFTWETQYDSVVDVTNVECVQCACSFWHNWLSLPFIVWRTWIYPIRWTGAFSAILPHPRVAVGRPIALYRWLLKPKSLWVSYWPIYMFSIYIWMCLCWLCCFLGAFSWISKISITSCMGVYYGPWVYAVYWYSSADAEQTGWRGWVTIIIWHLFESRIIKVKGSLHKQSVLCCRTSHINLYPYLGHLWLWTFSKVLVDPFHIT